MKKGNSVAIAMLFAALLAPNVSRGGESVAVPGEPSAVDELSPKEAAALIRENGSRKDFVVLDVRTPQEYRDGHIEGAVLIDYTSGSFREEVKRLDRKNTYVVYCRTGNRSEKAVAILTGLRFEKIRHLRGGILKWTEEGLPTVR